MKLVNALNLLQVKSVTTVHQESCRIENKEVPRSDGALIFEVKVTHVEFTESLYCRTGYVF